MKSRVLSPGSWLLSLDKGEELISLLTDFAEKENINFASVTGIGAASKVVLAVFDTGEKRYIERKFSGNLEIVSLMGNITQTKPETEDLKPETGNWEPKTHLHCVIAGDDLSAHAGHLVSAEISVTCELVLVVSKENIERKKDDETGLMLID